MASGRDKSIQSRADGSAAPAAAPAHAPRGSRGARIAEEEPVAVVDAYLDALAAHDYERARACLSDADFRYLSPVSSFSCADDFMLHMSLSGGILQKVERLKVFSDGPDVCHFMEMTIQLSDKESMRVAQWSRVASGRIVRIEVLFDAHRYRMMFEPPCGEAR